jgi:DNA polymerase III subunit chi
MAEVGFYILSTDSVQQRYAFACKLIEKAYRSGHFCYVLTDTIEQSRYLDDLLWTFRAGSFIPHQLYDGAILPALIVNGKSKVILIGTLKAPDHWQDTIINLSSHCPEDYDHVGRIFEILDDSETTKEPGRFRYRQYQESGLNITIHKMVQ